MTEKFKYDYYRMTGTSCKISFTLLKNLIFMHNIRFMYWWRKAQKGNMFAKFKVYRYSRKYGLEISPSANIGEGFYIGHPYNITIAAGTIIGNNVNIHKGATIGAENRGERKGTPEIGNRVYIGINSTITGSVSVGDDVIIAPNSFINFDVPSHSVVIGNPGVVHKKENATRGYIIFLIDDKE